MKVLITGVGGMTGTHLRPIFIQEGFEVVATDILPQEPSLGYLDVRDLNQVEDWVVKEKPDLVLHMAAETDVEVCEKEPDHAYKTNLIGTQNVALICQKYDLPMAYISTIGVFDGEKAGPYLETDLPNPPNVYGISKYGGELAVKSLLKKFYIIRASWMMGGGSKKDKKFIGKIIKQIMDGSQELWAVTDKVGSPTYSVDFSKCVAAIIKSGRYGIYHSACIDSCSRYDVALEITKILGRPDIKVHAISSTDPKIFKNYPTKRPTSEVMYDLMLNTLGLNKMRSWRESLHEYINEYFKEEKEVIAKQKPVSLTSEIKNLFVVAAHVFFYEGGDVHGSAHGLIGYLKKTGQPYLFLKHSTFSGFPGEIITALDPQQDPLIRKIGPKHWQVPYLQYGKELIRSLSSSWSLKKRGFRVVYIGVDPLNALVGYILRRLKRIDTFVAFTPDYSPVRFPNPLVNYLYHQIDKITTNRADFVWGVSKRIVDLRRKQGIPDQRNFQVPNSPSMQIVKTITPSSKNKFDLVIVSTLSKGVNFPILLRGVASLRKDFPHLRLRLIGSGDYEAELRQLVKELDIEDRILLLGQMSHEEVFKNLKECGVGIALYTNDAPWTYYSDPMKVRDYLACGIPVVMTDVPALAHEIQTAQAGEVIALAQDSFEAAIRKILTDDEKYSQYAENALLMGETYDLDSVLEKTLSRLDI